MTNIPLLLMPVVVLMGVTLMGGLVYLMATSKRNNQQFADGGTASGFQNRSRRS